MHDESEMFKNHGICRIVQLILEQNYDKEHQPLAKVIRVYAPYWFEIARCPPLTIRLLDSGKKHTRKISFPFQSRNFTEVVFEDITEEEIYEGHTIASALNFNLLGLSVSISQAGNDHFGPIKDLSPLGDMVDVQINFVRPSVIVKAEMNINTHFFFKLSGRMDHWISVLMMLMKNVCGFSFLQNLAPISLYPQRFHFLLFSLGVL